MAEAIFNYEGNNTTIQCEINEKMKDIINRFLIKLEKKEKNLYYLYDGTQINYELRFNEQANDIDKNRKKMNIIVTKSVDAKNIIKEIVSKDLICPECKENSLINFENFHAYFHDCKNNHNINTISLNEFEQTQKINLNDIICNECIVNNKGNIHNNEFYICNTCNINICPLCKTKHDKNHNIINYEDKNYICKKHNDEKFIKYCNTCKIDICMICEDEHEGHNTLDLRKLLIKNDELMNSMKYLNNVIDIFKYKINIIKEVLDRLVNTFDLYYKISNNIINNYNINKRNYSALKNLNNIKNNNEIIIEYINNIINNNQIFDIYKYPNDKFYNDKEGIYIGEMKNNMKNGKGSFYFNKDDEYKRKKYEGDFKNGLMEGKGIYYWNNGERCEGDFKNGKREGKGIYYYNSGSRYKGDYKNDKKEGKGIMYFNNGNRYEGDWIDNKREGKGIFYWNNGDRYEGDWKNDKREGIGIMYNNNGKKKEGIWKNDKLEKN